MELQVKIITDSNNYNHWIREKLMISDTLALYRVVDICPKLPFTKTKCKQLCAWGRRSSGRTHNMPSPNSDFSKIIDAVILSIPPEKLIPLIDKGFLSYGIRIQEIRLLN